MKYGLIVLLYRKRMTIVEGTIVLLNRPSSDGLFMIFVARSTFL